MSEPATTLPKVNPIEAIAFFKRKGFEFSFDWRDVWQEEHARAFTVAKAMTRDLLETIREAVAEALEEGETLAEFSKRLRPELERRGWWGRKLMPDPATGEIVDAQLGSPRRLRVIFNTNMRTAYQAGRWERIQRTKQAFPFLRYTSVMDGRERPQHHEWHGTILPVDDPWWDTHYGPCDWGCRCTATPVNQRMLARRGWQVDLEPKRFPDEVYVNRRTGEVSRLEQGIGPGWSYNVGKAYLDSLAPAPAPIDPASPQSAIAPGALAFAVAPASSIDAFLAAFGGPRVWEDAGGFPLAISTGWFRRLDGELVEPVTLAAGDVARVLRGASAIGWIWRSDREGRRMLRRRYVAELDGAVWSVEVGRAGWQAERHASLAEAEDGLLALIRPADLT